MIRSYVNGEWKDTEAIYAGGQTITAVYQGDRLVWEAGRCCFSKGPWLNDRPWINELGWKNNA